MSSPRICFFVGLAMTTGIPARGGTPPPASITQHAPVYPHRIIVKYRSTVSGCAHCLLARGVRFATVTGTDSLDRLHREFHVRQATPLFFENHERSGRAAAYRNTLDRARARFPLRSARARAGALAPDLSNTFVLEIGATDPGTAAAAFAADPDVEYAEPDYEVRVSFVPDDPYFSSSGSWGQSFPDLWGLLAADAASAWDTARGDGIVVAVIDTGVTYTHPDLRANMWKNPGEIPNNDIDDDGNGYVDDVYGWDFVKNRRTPRDQHGHGTHVAGIIAATGNNGTGVVGMAWGARVMSVRGLNAHGIGYVSDLAKGIVYAAQNGADVLNNSWGSATPSGTIADAVSTATSLGAVVVFAAGNSDSSALGDAADPDAIAVAATAYGDARASFSNYGPAISVAAPGVYILSLKGPGRVRGRTVGGRYRVLSGTSMAAPHVSGLAAVLLSQMPGLSSEEVRWHMELNADQPGYPGYEGQRWNPFFGFGRINAARVFDPPPAVTRITTPPFALHALAESIEAAIGTVDFSFTTLDPVAWSITAPAWLTPAVAEGSGSSRVSFSLDTRGLAPGAYAAPLTVSAPATVDGGGSIATGLQVHADPRAGGEIVVSDPYFPWGTSVPPRVASDGQGVFAAWVEWPSGSPFLLVGAYVNDDGTVIGPFVIDTGTCDFFCSKKIPENVAVAFDGTNFLVMWNETLEEFVSDTSLKTKNNRYMKAVRVTRSGQVLDAPPIQVSLTVEAESRTGGFDQYDYAMGLAFDGSAYTAIWGMLDFGSSSNPVQVFMRRVGADGSLLAATRKIYPVATTQYPQYIEPKIACAGSSCLVAWLESDGETDANGHYIDKLYGQRYQGDQIIEAVPFRILTDVENIVDVASSASGYAVVGYRAILTPGSPGSWGYDVIGARVTASGTPLDPSGIRLNNSAPGGAASVYPNALMFDGTNYIVTWGELPPFYDGKCYSFAARVSPDGTLLNDEPEGVLLMSRPTMRCAEPRIAATATKSLLFWADSGTTPNRILAQGVFAR